jgi:hypothetical protein
LVAVIQPPRPLSIQLLGGAILVKTSSSFSAKLDEKHLPLSLANRNAQVTGQNSMLVSFPMREKRHYWLSTII